MSWKVLITAHAFEMVGQAASDLLKSAGCQITITRSEPLSERLLLKELEGKDAVLCSPDPYSRRVLKSAQASNLKILSRWGVGYDSIDISAATEMGIVVAYTPGLLEEAVADYAFALLLTLSRRTTEAHSDMKKGKWRVKWGRDLFGKTLGIIGFGRIGQALARRAKGFGLRILGYDVFEKPAAKRLGVKLVPMDFLLSESDFVSLHVALTSQNHGMMGEAQFQKMKPEAIFINTARGACVNEAALIKALNEDQIGGAALDVYVKEPLPSEHPFHETKNLILSPHQASSTRETGARIAEQAAQSIVDLLSGKAPQFLVNPEVLKSPFLRAKMN